MSKENDIPSILNLDEDKIELSMGRKANESGVPRAKENKTLKTTKKYRRIRKEKNDMD